MAKARSKYVCSKCGRQSAAYMGRCPQCGEFGTYQEVVEEVRKAAANAPVRKAPGAMKAVPQKIKDISGDLGERYFVPVQELNRVLGGGLVPGSITLIGGEPGIGKCVTGDTRILDPVSGAYMPITEWENDLHHVASVDTTTLKIAPDETVAFHKQGIKPVLRLETRLGRVLRCTANHPLLTADGWRPLEALKAGDSIAAPRALPYFGSETRPEAELKLIAYILSDGAAGSQVSTTSMLPEVEQDVREIAERFGVDATVYVKPLTDVNKYIPEPIFKLPREQMALFLRVLFSCDGSVFVVNGENAGISYATISRKLAEDVQHLLLRFGFVSKLRTKPMIVNSQPYTAYEIQLLGIAEVRRFLTEIGIYGREEAKQRIAAMNTPKLPSTHRDTIPTGSAFYTRLAATAGTDNFAAISRQLGTVIKNRRHDRPVTRYLVERIATAYPDPYFERLAHGDVMWDEIVSIEPDGEEEVYDISVAEHHNFVANDLIVHNSTLLLQTSILLANSIGPVLYVSGEESAQQIKMRAERLNVTSDNLYLLTETLLENIFEHVTRLNPTVLIIDSIQTTYTETLEGSPGLVGQVRECASRLQGLAKTSGISVFLVGHVTKEGQIAGPRVLEHIVDTVLYLEGDPFQAFRLLRSVKNRFGATSEVGVFEMQGAGMVEVPNPSEAFLAERVVNAAGSCIAVTMEGTRPLLVELQALTSATSFGNPRRTPNGVDINRLLLISAVLTKRYGLRLHEQDIFVNVVGGMKISEPASDLAMAIAMASSYYDVAVPADMVIMGEVGLSGEVRAVSQLSARLNEASKIGFRRAIVPKMRRNIDGLPNGLELLSVRTLGDALKIAVPK
jgi:DNA repair protein RadA/Sms